MHTHKPFPDPANARAILDEADIGSGEKTPAEEETEAMIRQIPPLPPSGQADADADAADQEESDAADSSAFDAGETRERLEHDASLERDEPSEQLDDLDPVPPEGQ